MLISFCVNQKKHQIIMIRLILLTDFTEAFAHNLLKGILEYSKRNEPWVVSRMPPSYKKTFGIQGVLDWAKSWQADAIIGQFDDDDNVELFPQNGIIALAQDFKSKFTTIPNITSDYRLTGKIAADYFIKKGFKHFAYYGYKNSVWSKERYEGFLEHITKNKFSVNFYAYQEQLLDELWHYATTPLLTWLESLPKPTALMACDDTQGYRIAEVCRANNIKIPEEIAILGVDNDEMTCNMAVPPLSSIRLNIARGGFLAAELIEKLLKNKDSDFFDIIIQPIHVVERFSTNFYSSSDPHILTVLKYIHENLTSKLQVSDIVRQVPLSRRLLEIRFKQVTKQPIYKYIFKLRIDYFAQLLLTSTDPIVYVAAQAGLNDYRNLSRQFKALKKESPREYRKRHQVSYK